MTATNKRLRDGRGREVSYLRLSVTDRCNLNCMYCRPKDKVPFIAHPNILRYEEMLDLVALARNSFTGSFLGDAEKARHLAAIDAYA